MARNRFDNLEPERQEAILAAAAGEFAERGYAGASLSRIIERAGISKGSLYYYFDDKEDLFTTVVEVAVERLFGELGGLPIEEFTQDTYWNRVRDFGMQSVDVMRNEAWYARLVMAFPRMRDEPEARDAVRPALEWGRRYTRSLLGRGQTLGVVRQDLPLEFLVEVTMAADEAGDRWLVNHQHEFDDEGLARLIEARIDLLRDMLDARNEGWE